MKKRTKQEENSVMSENEGVELSEEDMDKVTGGVSAFANVPRVKQHDYDEAIKKKI